EKDEIDNIFSGTTWLRNDVVGEIFWGGKNQFRLFFKNKNDFEILRIRDGDISGLYQEGVYMFKNDTLKVLYKNTAGEITGTLKYKLLNSRTLAIVKSDGSLGTGTYDAYIKQ